MRLKKIKYKIAEWGNERTVDGYAIDCDLPVRLCVREVGPSEWRIDHYDTGYFIGPCFGTRDQAITRGINIVRSNLESGKYAEAIRAYNRRPGVSIHAA